ncbi:MAG: peptidylprolyl isomerase [Candidatus Symbiodolus clandestinus]
MVTLHTTQGDIVLQLYPDQAPNTVNNFLRYCHEGFYQNTVFHRVIQGFMIQGGGLTADMQQKKGLYPSIVNEANNRLANQRGTIAMARTSDPHSATAQFFINTVDNDFLNFRSETATGWGYCVFGEVMEGLTVIDQISQIKTAHHSGHQDVPVEPILITGVSLLKSN